MHCGDCIQDATVEVCVQQDPRFVTQLEHSVRFGKTMIIQVWFGEPEF